MAPPPPGWASPWGPGGCLRLLALTVLGLISVNAAAPVEPGARRVTKGQIPFRYARPPTQNRDRGGEHKNASGALRWVTHMTEAGERTRRGAGERGDAVAPPTEFSWHALIPGQGLSPRILRRVR